MKWRYNILMFCVAFVGSWIGFALVWWVQAVAHDDYRAANDTDWPACVSNVYDFHTALLFSIETQHTIGYGTRAIDTNCGWAVIILMLQSCYGVFVQSLMTGLIFAKLSRPKHRAQTMMFSSHAVICLRENGYCLLFRVGNMRRSHIIGTSIRGLLVKNRLTKEGESIPLCQYSLALQTETNFGENFIFLAWPMTVVHRIVSESPLWNVSAEELPAMHFEIIVILEGVVENTGMTTQFRTSYLPSEIKWGHHLRPLETHCKRNGQYVIKFRQFHETDVVESMPECSARIYSENRASAPQEENEEQCNGTIASDHVQRSVPKHLTTLAKLHW
jgi:potassium inwardly-rectifying channel subfamily J